MRIFGQHIGRNDQRFFPGERENGTVIAYSCKTGRNHVFIHGCEACDNIWFSFMSHDG